MKKKVMWITAAIAIVLLVFSVILMKGAFEQSVMNMVFDKEILIEDNAAVPDMTAVEFAIDESGEYRFVAEWETAEYGPLTGCIITDKDNQQLYQFTASTITLQSSILKLDEGEYKITLYHMADMNSIRVFVNLSVGRRTSRTGKNGKAIWWITEALIFNTIFRYRQKALVICFLLQ